MVKSGLLLISFLFLTLNANDTPAFGGDVTLVCFFHGTVYEILDVGNNQQDPAELCGVPSEQFINNSSAHKASMPIDVHDPECFSWNFIAAQ